MARGIKLKQLVLWKQLVLPLLLYHCFFSFSSCVTTFLLLLRYYCPAPPLSKKSGMAVAGTSVQDGEGKMIVTAVGLNTYQESLLAEKPKDKDPENTEAEDAPAEDNEKGGRSIMQKKLDDMTYQITNAGLIFGVGERTDLSGSCVYVLCVCQ
jgi:magnesium-transporting ATPase (P-type)